MFCDLCLGLCVETTENSEALSRLNNRIKVWENEAGLITEKKKMHMEEM